LGGKIQKWRLEFGDYDKTLQRSINPRHDGDVCVNMVLFWMTKCNKGRIDWCVLFIEFLILA